MTEAARSLLIGELPEPSELPNGSHSAKPVAAPDDSDVTSGPLSRGESERRLLEETHRAGQARYQILLEGGKDYAIYMLDPQGRVIDWNSNAERIKGYSSREIIGHNFSCFYPPEEVRAGRPAEALRLAAAFGRHEEYGMRMRRDSSRFFARVSVTALHDPAGTLIGFSELSRDLSEHDVASARYRALLEASLDAMVVLDRDQQIVLVNQLAEQQFGYSHVELLGKKIDMILNPAVAIWRVEENRAISRA